MQVFKTMAFTLGVSGLIELLIGVYGYAEGTVEIWRFEPLGLTPQTLSYPLWIGCLSVIFGATMSMLPLRRYWFAHNLNARTKSPRSPSTV